MNIEDLKQLSISEVRTLYTEYLYKMGLSGNTISTANNDSFYIWTKGSKDLFWDTVLADDFEDAARDVLSDLLSRYSKVPVSKSLSAYMSHVRRFRRFCELADIDFDIEPIGRHSEPGSQVGPQETIIINRMYAGGYLDENIGHEIINTFRTDAGENYIYINPWGVINSDAQFTQAVLLVRLINEHCYEVLGYASELTLLLSQEAMRRQNQAGVIDNERQKQLIMERDITYGGSGINDIFSEQDNTVFVTFRADRYRSVKPEKKLYIVDDEKAVLNDAYIYLPDFKFSKTSLKRYAMSAIDHATYKVLDALIYDEKYWCSENTTRAVSDEVTTDSTFGILDVLGKSDDELAYSNWFSYYLKNDVSVFERFVSEILHVKMDGKKSTVRREYHNIDLWIEDDEHIVVIENKVKSGINGVDAERHDIKTEPIQSQLKKYYEFAEQEADGRTVHCYLFLPDYSYKDEDLSLYLCGDKYEIVRYSQLAAFFEGVDGNVPYIDEFTKALRKHATPYHTDFYQITEERLISRIRKLK